MKKEILAIAIIALIAITGCSQETAQENSEQDTIENLSEEIDDFNELENELNELEDLNLDLLDF